VVSNRGSLPEVVGKAGVIVDPNSHESIARGLEKVLSASEIEYNKMVEAGLSRVKEFSWEITAKKTLEILEHVQR
jgi:glycosyltransferase involved in cell wall biosynthesis